MIVTVLWIVVIIAGLALAALITGLVVAFIYRDKGKGAHASGDTSWPTFQAEAPLTELLPQRTYTAPTAVHQWAAEAWRAIGAVPAVPYVRYEPDALDARVAGFEPPEDVIPARVVAALTRAGSEDTVVRMSDLEPIIGGDPFNGLGRDGYVDQFDAIAARARDRLALIRVSVTA